MIIYGSLRSLFCNKTLLSLATLGSSTLRVSRSGSETPQVVLTLRVIRLDEVERQTRRDKGLAALKILSLRLEFSGQALYFGLLAPYLLLCCLRSTPALSRMPRTI